MSCLINLSVLLPTIPSSHWSRTLGTRGVPSKTEANDIRNIISLGNSNLSKLDVDIGRVQEVLKQLSRWRHDMSEHIMNHSTVLSSVRKIPDEVLAEIFTYCLPRFEKKGKWKSSFRRDQAPVLLGQICSRWRAVALSTQALWSCIRIDYGSVTVKSDVEKMSLWLERSGTHPLSLVLRERMELSDYSREKSALMLDTILPSSHRWQDVDIYTLRDTVDGLSQIRNALPLLQSLALRVYCANPMQPCCYDAFEIAPALRTVDLGLNVLSTSLKLPWINLTDFSSHDTPYMPAACLEILRICPNLTSCHFGLLYDYEIEPTTPHLRHCQLINFSIRPESQLGSFFDCLTLPALRAVCLDPPRASRWPGPPFLDLLRRSFCTLEKFTWAMDPVKIKYIVQCLKNMPDLKDLRIMPDLGYSLPKLLQSLTLGTPDETETRLCPKLQVVQLSVSHGFNAEALSAFIRSRRNTETVRDGAVQFKCIRLHPVVQPWEPETALRDLKEFQDDGLDILVDDLEGVLRQVVLQ